MPWQETCVLVVSGLAIGSFLNVVIHRVPRRASVVAPPSHCPTCDTPIAPYDNIPLASWIILRGRCRHCHARISSRYPAIEAATALLFVGSGLEFGTAHLTVAASCLFFAALLAISAVDLEHLLIPNRMVFPALIAVAALLAADTLVHAHPHFHRIEDAAIGAGGSFAFFAAVHLVYPAGMGFGDVKLSLLIGMFLGWLRLGIVPVGYFLAFLLATVVSLGLIVAGRGGRKTKIPFGPFLSAGALAAVVWGPSILRVWLGR